jgi:hypothetical protein
MLQRSELELAAPKPRWSRNRVSIFMNDPHGGEAPERAHGARRRFCVARASWLTGDRCNCWQCAALALARFSTSVGDRTAFNQRASAQVTLGGKADQGETEEQQR